jgi:lipoprotein-releasing system permease protein
LKTGSAFFIAFRYLLGRAHEGGRYLRGAAAGIALSLIPIVVTLIVADGMIRGITDRYLELGTGHIQIYNYQNTREPEAALQYIEGLPGIRGIWPERHGLAVLLGSAGSRGATIRAVDRTFWEDEGSRKYLKVLSGEAIPETDKDVLLGEELARSIGASAGSTVRIMTIRASQSGRAIPRVTAFTVRGIVSSGYRELDSLWCIMNLEAGKQVLSDSGGAYLMLKIDEPYKGAEPLARSLYEILDSGFGVYTWKTLQYSQYSSYETTRQLLLFIMALIVLVAAVNVSSATSMLVIERQRDIALLKVSGARPSFTSGIFLWGAFLTGIAGSVFGIAAGLVIGCSVNGLIKTLETVLSFFSGLFHAGPVTILNSGYYLETIPIIVNWNAVFLIAFFTILSSSLASWLPARRAGKLKPIEILRKY